MNYWESIKELCKHIAYRPIIMKGVIMHWRCRCGKIVAAPKETTDE